MGAHNKKKEFKKSNWFQIHISNCLKSWYSFYLFFPLITAPSPGYQHYDPYLFKYLSVSQFHSWLSVIHCYAHSSQTSLTIMNTVIFSPRTSLDLVKYCFLIVTTLTCLIKFLIRKPYIPFIKSLLISYSSMYRPP